MQSGPRTSDEMRKKMSYDFEKLIQECEGDIRLGRVEKAVKRLSLVIPSQLSRAQRLPLASICRRLGLVNLGLRILNPITVAKQKRLDIEPTPEELCEYAILVMRNGSVDESIEILSSLPEEKVPAALLYRSFCLFSTWRYAEAIPFLERYVEKVGSPYSRLLGMVNLASALAMVRRNEEALGLLGVALEGAKAADNVRIESNCRALLAQSYAQLGNLSKARSEVELGLRLIDSDRTYDAFYLLKWRAFLDALDRSDATPLEKLRDDARTKAHYETVRDADFLIAKAFGDSAAIERLFFGTPFPAFRQRLVDEIDHLPSSLFAYYGGRSERVLDLLTGEISGASGFKPGGKIHQTVEVLVSDWYKPPSIGKLFSELCPDERFDLFSSATRIHQSLRRVRRWFEQMEIPAAIVESKGTYRIKVHGPFAIRVPRSRTPVDWFEIHLRKLCESGSSSFTVKEIRRRLKVGDAEYRRFVKEALESGRLSREGATTTLVYRLAA